MQSSHQEVEYRALPVLYLTTPCSETFRFAQEINIRMDLSGRTLRSKTVKSLSISRSHFLQLTDTDSKRFLKGIAEKADIY